MIVMIAQRIKEKLETKQSCKTTIFIYINFLNHSISMNKNGALNSTSEGNLYVNIIVETFVIYSIIIPTPEKTVITL